MNIYYEASPEPAEIFARHGDDGAILANLYPCPHAELDGYCLKLRVHYPSGPVKWVAIPYPVEYYETVEEASTRLDKFVGMHDISHLYLHIAGMAAAESVVRQALSAG